jgi:hypothetical protein
LENRPTTFEAQRRSVALAFALFACLNAACGASAAESVGPDPDGVAIGLPVVADLPDPFLFENGERVASPSQWSARREEIKELFAFYEYGHLPPAPGNVNAAELSAAPVFGGTTTRNVVRLTMGPNRSITLDVNVYVPVGKPGPFPAVVTGDLGWGSLLDKGGWNAAEFVDRGYVIAEFDRTAIAPDQKGAFGACDAAYPSYEWAAIAVWAWAYERVVDYLVTASFVDSAKIAVTGHSRGAKACLLAGAVDERIALTAPNASGCGGASAYRFAIAVPTAENLAAITTSFPYWFEPRLQAFAEQETRLPFDQHELVALVAPRAFLSTNALGDAWANPEGAQQTHVAAQQVFAYLDAGNRIGITFRPGGHDQSLDDWRALIDFCDAVLMGKAVARRFDALPFGGLAKGFSWTTPGT